MEACFMPVILLAKDSTSSWYYQFNVFSKLACLLKLIKYKNFLTFIKELFFVKWVQ